MRNFYISLGGRVLGSRGLPIFLSEGERGLSSHYGKTRKSPTEINQTYRGDKTQLTKLTVNYFHYYHNHYYHYAQDTIYWIPHLLKNSFTAP